MALQVRLILGVVLLGDLRVRHVLLAVLLLAVAMPPLLSTGIVGESAVPLVALRLRSGALALPDLGLVGQPRVLARPLREGRVLAMVLLVLVAEVVVLA